uniref:Mdh6 n=1 Tax=Arundo donax TaxID=35708 RepID=A0A0A9CTD8_ARUDO
MLTSRSNGYSESSSSIATPSSACNDLSEPSNLSAIGWSGPKTSPDASLKSR